MTFKEIFLFLPFLALLTGFFFYSIYQEVEQQTIIEFNEQQMIIAKQTAKGIEHYCSNIEHKGKSIFTTAKDNGSVINTILK
jgi:hypothetical protein